MVPVRPIRIEGDIAYITLTKGKVAIIDADDVEKVRTRNWNMSGRYVRGTIRKGEDIFLHRFIFKPPIGMQVDHINCNPLDCRRVNMRLCTCAQNNRNVKRQSINKSGYKGVYWDKFRNKWHSQITINYKALFLGRFDKIEDAEKAYRDGAVKYHGEFANFGGGQ